MAAHRSLSVLIEALTLAAMVSIQMKSTPSSIRHSILGRCQSFISYKQQRGGREEKEGTGEGEYGRERNEDEEEREGT